MNSESGLPRLVAERDGEGHADRAWTAFMCCAGADPMIVGGETGVLDFYRERAAALKARMGAKETSA